MLAKLSSEKVQSWPGRTCTQTIFRVRDWRGFQGARSHALTSSRVCRLTDAFALVRHSDGSAQEAGRSSQVTRAGIDDPVVSHTGTDQATSPRGKSDYTSHNMHYLSGPRRTWSCRGTGRHGTFLSRQRNLEILLKPARNPRKWRTGCRGSWQMQTRNLISGAELKELFTYSCTFPGTARPGQGGLCI